MVTNMSNHTIVVLSYKGLLQSEQVGTMKDTSSLQVIYLPRVSCKDGGTNWKENWKNLLTKLAHVY